MTENPSETETGIELAPGVLVRRVEAAQSAQHVSEFLSEATHEKTTVLPFGGKRSLATGNLPRQADHGLDLTGLSGIISYEPADLTVSVLAGTLVSDLLRELQANGQELPIDVSHPDHTTIGGLVATGFAGPRKLRSGSLRDLLIGCEYVRGDGLLAKAGGMVVKNVSGFEIPRFLHGSWGALAVLTSVNLKVTPRPKADGTIVCAFADVSEAIDAGLRLIASEPSIEACEVVRDPTGCRLAARAVGRAAAVAETLDSFAGELPGSAERLHDEASTVWWQNRVDAFSERDSSVLVALSARPRDVRQLAASIDATLADPPDARLAVSPGLGSIRVVVGDNNVESFLLNVLAESRECEATWVVESAPPAVRSVIAAWGPLQDGIQVMQSIKREFDPAGVLNPDRLVV